MGENPEPTSFEQLRDLLAELRAEDPRAISPSTRLREDLGIDGDDWDEVAMAITERWQVDWAGFKFHDYFREEPHLLSLLRLARDLIAGRKLRPLTVSHLTLVVDRGRWCEPAEAAA